MQSKFERECNKANDKKMYGKYAQALHFYIRAKCRNGTIQGQINLLTVYVQIAEMNRRLKRYKDSKYYFEEAYHRFLQMRNPTKEQPILQQFQFKMASNWALLEVDEADLIDPYVNWEGFKKLIDSSIYKLKNALKITINTLVSNKSEDNQAWWSQQYIATILNIINPLDLEAQKFQDKEISEIIIKLIEKAQRFYERSPYQRKLKNNISKSYYFKAIAYRNLRKFVQCQRYFKLDYDHCKKERLEDDFEKTRKRIIDLMLYLERFEDTKKFLTQTDQKQTYGELIRSINEIDDDIRIIKFDPSDQKIINVIIKMNQQKLNKKLINFSQNHFHRNYEKKTLCLLNYYAAISYFQMDNFRIGYPHAMEAVKFSEPFTQMHFDALYLKIQYAEFLKHDRQTILQLFNEWNRVAENLSQNHLQIIQTERRNFQIQEKRKKRKEGFQFDFENQKKLLLKMQQKKEENENSEDSKNYGEKINFFKPKAKIPKKTKNQEIKEKYENLCSEQNLEKRQYTIEQIQKCKNDQNPQIDLSLLFNLNENELQIYFKIFQIKDIDLRNHKISPVLLQSIASKPNVYAIESLKIANNIPKIDNLTDLLIKIENLQILTLKNVKAILQVSLTNHLYEPRMITILKLKNCAIKDEYLQSLKKCQNLKKLDLSSNVLDGQSLHLIDSFSSLRELNLSRNPLKKMNSFGKNLLQKLKLKGIHKIANTKPLVPQLIKVQTLDLSENSWQNIVEVLSALIENQYERENLNLPQLREIILKQCNINEHCLKTLKSLCLMTPSLDRLDIRYSYLQFEEEEIDWFKSRAREVEWQVLNPQPYSYKRYK